MIQFEPASFKDPAGRVFYLDGAVFRTLSEQAQLEFQAALSAGLISDLIRSGLLLETEFVPAAAAGLPAPPSTGVLRQPRVTFVSYAYEWSFAMLRDAALVTLRALDLALRAGFILKDAHSFNVLFEGTRPRLVDVLSLERHSEGTVWGGYAQFCRSFLFPLLVKAHRDVDFQPLLRATMGELAVQDVAKLFGRLDFLKAGVLKDVFLQARLEQSFGKSASAVRTEAQSRSYPTALILANVRRLTRIVEGLTQSSRPGMWASYEDTNSYDERDLATKTAFVQRFLTEGPFKRVVDVGCNTGRYSEFAASAGAQVIVLDLDPGAIDLLYRRLSPTTAVSPVVANLLNPSPAMGWALKERRSLLERVTGDAVLALAVVHHLRITGGVPLAAVIEQLLAVAPEGIIEWIDKDDAMVRDMLALRPDVYEDYTWANFQNVVRERADILCVADTHAGRRRLCHVRKR